MTTMHDNMLSEAGEPFAPCDLMRAKRPSTALLRKWAENPDNETCWALRQIADDYDALFAAVIAIEMESRTQRDLDVIHRLALDAIHKVTR